MAANLHLEHAEDLMLMMGASGVDEALEYFDDLVKTFSSTPKGNQNITTKWDGSPSIFCGPDPADGRFFVGKKGVFNKTPQMYKSLDEINKDNIVPDLKKAFTAIFKGFEPLYRSGKLKDVVQGDFLFHADSRKIVRDVHGENCVMFKPQLISYCIPDHDELYDAAKVCKACVVIHAKYPAPPGAKTVHDLQVNFGFDASQFSTRDFLILTPYTSELGSQMVLTRGEKNRIIRHRTAAKNLLRQCYKFLDTIAESHDDTFGIAYFIKQYFNARVRQGQKVTSAARFYKDFCDYYEEKFRAKWSSLSQPPKIAAWKKRFYEGYEYLHDHKREFIAMVGIYNSIQNIKPIFIPKFEAGERFKTFYYNEDDGTYEVGDQEGYVIVRDSTRAVKIVQRLGGFSERNFNEIKKWAKK